MNQPEETMEQFISGYASRSGIPREAMKMVSMVCTCEEGGSSPHWAAVGNDSLSIQLHLFQERLRQQSLKQKETR